MGRIRVGDSEIIGNGKISDIMSSNGLFVDAYIYIMEGVPVPSDTIVEDDYVDAVRVASGG